MRLPIFLCLTYLISISNAGISRDEDKALRPRQDNTNTETINTETITSSPTVTSNDGSQSTSDQAEPEQTSTTVTSEESSSTTSTTSSQSDSSSIQSSTVTSLASASASSTATPTPITSNSTVTDVPNAENVLPLTPEITPALSVAGVILMLTGLVYGLIGVKNRWIHIFMSTAYLSSLCVTVLINYVMKPHISNAVQGAYFVAVFMTGVIFGAGALVFREMTEGLGCLLGGFCFSMWLLTMKPGGLITSSVGKGIFVAALCVVGWSLSFSHYTRAYGLIGCIAFAGATAFVIGMDCFSRAGMKEFWFYIWGLNNDIFPLNTETYPITRGIRVEIVVILLCSIIGIMSQMKLWMVLKEKQRQREVTRLEHEQQRNINEEELGRNLNQKVEVDRANWENQYGSRPQSKRKTMLWTQAHPEERFSRVKPLDTQPDSKASASSESVELSDIEPQRNSSVKEAKDKSGTEVTIERIEEEREVQEQQAEQGEQGKESPLVNPGSRATSTKEDGDDIRSSVERQRALDVLERAGSLTEETISIPQESENNAPTVVPLPFKIPGVDDQSRPDDAPVAGRNNKSTSDAKRGSRRASQKDPLGSGSNNFKRMSTVGANQQSDIDSDTEVRHDHNEESKIEDAKESSQKGRRRTSRRHSIRSVLSRSSRQSSEYFPTSESREALVLPQLHHSRASSVAATMNDENEHLDTHSLRSLATRDSGEGHEPRQAASNDVPKYRAEEYEPIIDVRDAPPSPPALSSSSEHDPEELSRPVPAETLGEPKHRNSAFIADTSIETMPQQFAKSEKRTIDEHAGSENPATQASENDALTKGALDQVPSQLSNVVLSYRTNEWAKHISVADDPVYDEPQAVEGMAEEASVQLVPRSLPSTEKAPDLNRSLSTSSKPPVPHVATSDDNNIERRPRPNSRTVSDQQDETIALMASSIAIAAKSNKAAASRNKRNSLPIDHVKQSLATTPIDENKPSNFAATQPVQQRRPVLQSSESFNNTFATGPNSRSGMRSPIPDDTTQHPTYRSSSRNGSYGPAVAYQRSGSAMSNRSDVQADSRPGSATGHRPVIRTDTRMNSYESRLPHRREREVEAERRETLLTEWRVSQHHGQVINTLPKVGVENRRSQMMVDRDQKRLAEERQRAANHQKQFAMDQVMRRPDMQDLHRAAMRKMQADANKKL